MFELQRTPCRATRVPPNQNLQPSGWQNLPRRDFSHVMNAVTNFQTPPRLPGSVLGLTIYDHPQSAMPTQPSLALTNGLLALTDGESPPQTCLEGLPPPTNGQVAQLSNGHAPPQTYLRGGPPTPKMPQTQLVGAQQPAQTNQGKGNVDVMLNQLLDQANGVDPAGQSTKPAAAKPPKKKNKPKAKAKAKGKAKPEPKGVVSSKKIVLGCSKCRYSKSGCNDTADGSYGCRNPKFSGKRGHR